MPRILTGIQSSGSPHLGNILGAIRPALALSNAQQEPSFFFIADLHSLTTVRNPQELKKNTLEVAATWLACGLNPQKDYFYRQSHVPEVCEFTWYLNCFTPYPMLANAHSFKDKSANLANVNAGLFIYPVLMAADILLYEAEVVPVGKDQKQHLEITRDIAGAFNRQYGDILVIPEPLINEQVMVIPGTDGRKMSKSYNNYINIFDSEKDLRKKVMSIVTDSTPVEAPKNPDTCNVFQVYKHIAPPDEVESLRQAYLAGGLGYGKAKELLYEAVLQNFQKERILYQELMQDPAQIEKTLKQGEEKAREVALKVLNRVRKAMGYY
ncbi:MAG: tryptophan--tRNA ligase [Bacteroidia bacterium]|nr:tryptophan--tRNA ligase [Bacteroidia bacterium]MDW8157445.1 tryptophan--tRNA ligase [Bacteroidia bacterium]